MILEGKPEFMFYHFEKRVSCKPCSRQPLGYCVCRETESARMLLCPAGVYIPRYERNPTFAPFVSTRCPCGVFSRQD